MIRICRFAFSVVLLFAPACLGQDDPGRAAYARVCEACHGPMGKGGGQGPALVPFEIELGELVTIVRQGIGMMPAISRDRISDEEISQVRAYLLALSQAEAATLSSGTGSTSTASSESLPSSTRAMPSATVMNPFCRAGCRAIPGSGLAASGSNRRRGRYG